MSSLWQTITHLSTRLQFKHKIVLLICLSLSCYTIITSETISLLIGFDKNFSKASKNPIQTNYDRRHGFRTTDSNGNLLYYHLPNLTDYHIIYFYKPIADNGRHLCHVLGTDWNQTNTRLKTSNSEEIECVCADGYSGPDCGVPSTVYTSLSHINTSRLKIKRLSKPNRLVLSVILYLPDEMSTEVSLSFFKHVNSTLSSLSELVDLFIITRIITIDENRTASDDLFRCGPNAVPNSVNMSANCTKESQNKSVDITNLFSSQWNRFSDIVLYSTVNLTRNQLSKVGANDLHLYVMSKVWNTCVQSVTDFRPNDFLIFMSSNTFPLKPIVMFLKHYSGYPEPIKLLSHSKKWSKLDRSGDTAWKVLNNPVIANNNRLVNIAVTFEYLSLLCRYDFQLFKTNLCVNNQPNVGKFNRTYWPIKYWSIGDRNRLNQSANTLLPYFWLTLQLYRSHALNRWSLDWWLHCHLSSDPALSLRPPNRIRCVSHLSPDYNHFIMLLNIDFCAKKLKSTYETRFAAILVINYQMLLSNKL